MGRVKSFQRKVSRRLAAAGLRFDEIDSYGDLVSCKLRVDRLEQPAKLYAWQILDCWPDSEIYDYFQADGADGQAYLVIRFTPGDFTTPIPLDAKTPQGWLNPPRLERTRPAAKAAKATPKPAPKPEPPAAAPAPVIPTGRGSYRLKGLEPEVGRIAWTTIPKKKDGTLKQARCQIEDIEGERVAVQVTKTGQRLSVPLTKLFDHVPHQVGQVWH